MSILQLGTDRPAAVPQPDSAPTETSPAAKLQKQLHRGFAATVAIGLTFACLYVGGRVYAAKRVQRVTPPVIRVAPLAQSVAAVKPAENAAQPATPTHSTDSPQWNLVDPRPGESYLQLSAIPARNIDPFLQELGSKGFRPVIAPCPTDGLYRILIGPYASAQALQDAQVAVQPAGIKTIPRVY